MPFLSFLIPSYNTQDYIQQCIDSIIEQSFADVDVEIIIYDQSTDETRKLLNEKYSENKSIKLIYASFPSVYEARKALIKAARGDYIWMVDSDDLIASKSVNHIIGFIKENRPDVLLLPSAMFVESVNDANLIHNNLCHYNSVEEYKKDLFYTDKNNSLCYKIFKRSLFNNLDFNNVPNIRIGEDKMWNIAISKNIKKVVSFEYAPVYYYRQNQSSMTKLINPNSFINDFVNNFNYSFSILNGDCLFEKNEYSLFYLSCLANIIKVYLKSSKRSKKEAKQSLKSIKNTRLYKMLFYKINRLHRLSNFIVLLLFKIGLI